jgi:coniferyl-aldehyde dehydrogenase
MSSRAQSWDGEFLAACGRGAGARAASRDLASAATERAAADEVGRAIERARAAQRADGPPRSDIRLDRLTRLEEMLTRNSDAFADAICRDFGGGSDALPRSEIDSVIRETRLMRRHFKQWRRPERRGAGLLFPIGRAQVRYQPLGVIGIIGSSGCPLASTLRPVAAGLAAGNRFVIKPSERMPMTGELLRRLVQDTLSQDVITVLTGGSELGQAMAGAPFDHIVFTGSERVAKQVMRSASANLTPVTLVIGGKAPAIVDDEYPIDEAAERILSHKLLHSGQTCVAPDYALVPARRLHEMVRACRDAALRLRAHANALRPISEAQGERLAWLLDDARRRGARVIELDIESAPAGRSRWFKPALVLDVSDDMKLMQGEICGPILPIKTYGAFNQVIDYINSKPRALALYIFSHDRERVRRISSRITSGGMSVNGARIEALPLGVGSSRQDQGMDAFRAFSVKKAVLRPGLAAHAGMLLSRYSPLINRLMRLACAR